MCIGNMRSGTEALCAYFHTGDKEILHKALTYFGVVLLFALGAGVGSIATLRWGAGTIWLSCGLLTVSFLMGISLVPTLILLFLLTSSCGLIFGNASALALNEARHMAGSASDGTFLH